MTATIDLPRAGGFALRDRAELEYWSHLANQNPAVIRMDKVEPSDAEPVEVYKRRGDLAMWMLEELPSLRPLSPEGTYLFINIERCTRDSRAFARRLLERYEVAAVPGAVLDVPGEGHLRFSLTVDEKQLREAMNRLLDCAGSFLN